jgi:hypothetical protein
MTLIFHNTRWILPAVCVAIWLTAALALPCMGQVTEDRSSGTPVPTRATPQSRLLAPTGRSFLWAISGGQEIALTEWSLARLSRDHLRHEQEIAEQSESPPSPLAFSADHGMLCMGAGGHRAGIRRT